MQFSKYILTEDLSVIKDLKFFRSLITGKTSYLNSTALLIGLTAESFESVSVSMLKTNAVANRSLVAWQIGANLHIFTIYQAQSIFYFYKSGGHLLSHIVSNIVPSADQVLTSVFGMGTGVTPDRIATRNISLLMRFFRIYNESCSSALAERTSLFNSSLITQQ